MSRLVDTETVAQLICDPNVDEAENEDVDRNVEFDVEKNEHYDEEDKEPCRPVSWTAVHAKCVRDCDLRVHRPRPLVMSSQLIHRSITGCPPLCCRCFKRRSFRSNLSPEQIG